MTDLDLPAIRARLFDLRWLTPDNPPVGPISIYRDDIAAQEATTR